VIALHIGFPEIMVAKLGCEIGDSQSTS